MLLPLGFTIERLEGAEKSALSLSLFVQSFNKLFHPRFHTGIATSMPVLNALIDAGVDWNRVDTVLCSLNPNESPPGKLPLEKIKFAGFIDPQAGDKSLRLLSSRLYDSFYILPHEKYSMKEHTTLATQASAPVFLYPRFADTPTSQYPKAHRFERSFSQSFASSDRSALINPDVTVWSQTNTVDISRIADFQILSSSRGSDAATVSIIIPTYKRERPLLHALQSLVTQDFDLSRIEIIILDDALEPSANTEEAFDLLNQRQFAYQYVHCRHWNTTGTKANVPGSKRNLGALLSTSETLIFMDADTCMGEQTLKSLVSWLSDFDLVMPRRYQLEKDGKTLSPRLTHDHDGYWESFFERSDWVTLERPWKYVSTFCLGLKKSLFFKAGGFRESFYTYGCEDTELGHRLFRIPGFRPKLVPEPVFHIHPDEKLSPSSYDHKLRMLKLAPSAVNFYCNTLDPSLFEIYETMKEPHSLWSKFLSKF